MGIGTWSGSGRSEQFAGSGSELELTELSVMTISGRRVESREECLVRLWEEPLVGGFEFLLDVLERGAAEDEVV
jgi:hypothetical protein